MKQAQIDISNNGEVLIGLARYTDDPNRRGIVVYRNKNGNYQRGQTVR